MTCSKQPAHSQSFQCQKLVGPRWSVGRNYVRPAFSFRCGNRSLGVARKFPNGLKLPKRATCSRPTASKRSHGKHIRNPWPVITLLVGNENWNACLFYTVYPIWFRESPTSGTISEPLGLIPYLSHEDVLGPRRPRTSRPVWFLGARAMGCPSLPRTKRQTVGAQLQTVTERPKNPEPTKILVRHVRYNHLFEGSSAQLVLRPGRGKMMHHVDSARKHEQSPIRKTVLVIVDPRLHQLSLGGGGVQLTSNN